MTLAESLTRSTDWSRYALQRGTGDELQLALLEFISSDDSERLSELWWGLEGVIFSQNTVYRGAEPAIDVLMASLVDDRPAITRAWIIEAIRFVLSCGSIEDPELPVRCMARARLGGWLLTQLALEAQGPDRKGLLELLDLLDPGLEDLARSGAEKT
ncbi:MAG: hypothetical protein AAGD33_09985 [Actinomycetota bacterium]